MTRSSHPLKQYNRSVHQHPKPSHWLLTSLLLISLLTACVQAYDRGNTTTPSFSLAQPEELVPASLGSGDRLRIVASTSIIADIAANVGGDHVNLALLIPRGTDPHAYQPTPGDLQALYQADVILLNGFGLEAELADVLAPVSAEVPVIALSEGLPARTLEAAGEDSHAEGLDPHVWFDPILVSGWVDRIERALSQRDPSNASSYAANGKRYRMELEALDTWIEDQVSFIPPDRRKLVLDHFVLGYFAERYGFEITSALVPAFSSAAEASPGELAALSKAIRAQGIPAIFIGFDTNPRLAEGLAADLGLQITQLYTGSLGPADSPAATYLEMMQYNVLEIVRTISP